MATKPPDFRHDEHRPRASYAETNIGPRRGEVFITPIELRRGMRVEIAWRCDDGRLSGSYLLDQGDASGPIALARALAALAAADLRLGIEPDLDADARALKARK